MPWFKITLERCGFGRDVGPPPSFRFGSVRLRWWGKDWNELFDKMDRALKAAREEMRK